MESAHGRGEGVGVGGLADKRLSALLGAEASARGGWHSAPSVSRVKLSMRVTKEWVVTFTQLGAE